VREADGSGELKSMWVDPYCRGAGLGRLLLAAVEAAARRQGLAILRLETGIHQPEALGLYRAQGFREIGPFGSYRSDPLSVFMAKQLADGPR
jgi:putative acetyltransferase